MQIEIRSRDLAIDDVLRTQIERRLHFALARFGDRIARVTARLADVNGPRGGKDKSCRLHVELSPAGSLLAGDLDSSMTVAVDRAAEKAGRSVARELERQRELRPAEVAPGRLRARRRTTGR